MDVSAVAADPYDLFAALKNDTLFEIFEQCIIALLVLFFNLADHLKERGYAVESLFAGDLGKLLVHLGPLVVFACRRVAQIVYSRGHCAVVQLLEPDLRVLLFVVRSLGENRGYLLVAVLLRL